jgi:type IV pilus assembly protein PilC
MATTADSGGAPKRAPRKRTAARKPSVVTSGVESLVESPVTPPPQEVVFRGQEEALPQPSTSPFSLGSSIRRGDVTVFLRQMIMLLEAGTPILKSLRTLAQRGERAAMRNLIADIAAYVEAGNPLWQAFDRHPRYFDTVFVNLIRAAEASGTLVDVLKRVTTYREEREMLARRVRGAMIYPIILVVACFGVIILLTKVVVPEFAAMFEKANMPLPNQTRVFLAVSNLVAEFWYLPILLVIALIAVYKLWFVRNPVRRLTADRLKLKIPIIGPILHKNAIVEFTRTLSVLLRSGLSMMATLDLTRSAIHNRAVAQSLQDIRDSVEQGGGMEAPMRANADVLPPVVTDMFVTGEESGRVDLVAEQIADRYEEEVEIAVSTLGETLQPVFTLAIGVVVIILFISLFMPILGMIEQLTSNAAA